VRLAVGVICCEPCQGALTCKWLLMWVPKMFVSLSLP